MQRVAYWLLWPLIWVYAPLTVRGRILVVRGDTFLAVQPKFGSGRWQLPGGGINKAEVPLAAAVRELYEETGLQANANDVSELLPAATYHETGLYLRYIVFLLCDTSMSEIKIPENEIARYTWLPLLDPPQNSDQHIIASLQAFAR